MYFPIKHLEHFKSFCLYKIRRSCTPPMNWLKTRFYRVLLFYVEFLTFFDSTVGFQTSGSGYRVIWTRRIRIRGQKLPIPSVRAEQLEKTKNTKIYFRFFGHNSVPGPRIWTKLGGCFSQESPGPF